MWQKKVTCIYIIILVNEELANFFDNIWVVGCKVFVVIVMKDDFGHIAGCVLYSSLPFLETENSSMNDVMAIPSLTDDLAWEFGCGLRIYVC